MIAKTRQYTARALAVLMAILWTSLSLACDRYDGTNLTMDRVIVGNQVYLNVVARVTLQDVRAVGISVASVTSVNTYDVYDAGAGLLSSPCVVVNGTTYGSVVVRIALNQVVSFSGFYAQPTTAPVLITNVPLPNATVGTAYQQSVVANVIPQGQYTYSMDTLANGSLPSGMTLDLNGMLKGTPFATGATDINGNQVSKSYSFGVCATDTFSRVTTSPCPQTTITVDPALPSLAGTWSGSWSTTGLGDGGCTYHNSGNMTFVLKQTGTSITGTVSVTGIELRWIDDCSFAQYTSSQSSITGTASTSGISLQYSLPIAETGGNPSYSWSATLSGTTTLKGTKVSTNGSTGSFTLTKQ